MARAARAVAEAEFDGRAQVARTVAVYDAARERRPARSG
jgi:hypothetical protein